MSASNFGDSMEWPGRGRSSLSSPGSRTKGKRATGNSSSDKPRQPQRGLGVAQLEKIRMQNEMAEYFHHPQPPPPSSIHGAAGSPNLEDALLSPPSSSSYHANINVSSPYPIHPNLVMAYHGGTGDMRYGGSQSNPIVRISPPNYHGALYGASQYYSHPSSGDLTLPLFESDDSTICFKGQQEYLNHSAPVDHSSSGSMNSDEYPQDVDLELKL